MDNRRVHGRILTAQIRCLTAQDDTMFSRFVGAPADARPNPLIMSLSNFSFFNRSIQ